MSGTLLQLADQLGQPEAVPTNLIAEVRHEHAPIQLEYMRIADHFGIPPLFRYVYARLSVVPHPVDQIRTACITNAIAVFFAAKPAAVPIAKEHMIDAAGIGHVRTCLGLVIFDTAFDQILVDLGPSDAVRRERHTYLVDRFGAPVDQLPFAPRDVP